MNLSAILGEVGKVIKGKDEVVLKALICFLSGGHLLIEDVPGVGKTVLVLSLARVMGLSFSRIQFTSDLLPSDITGSSIFDSSRKEFVFREGPIFSNIVLADEINRATPKTQSALLEAMAEGQVTVDGKSYTLPKPFFVVATQNPMEHYGTYPLPESQLDRFSMRISVGYPPKSVERNILMGINPLNLVDSLKEVVSRREILEALEDVKKVYVSEEVAEFIMEIVDRTRNHPGILLGVSTRGALQLVQCAKALAYLRDRDFIVPEDALEVVSDSLSHRIIVREGLSPEEVLREIVSGIKVPR